MLFFIKAKDSGLLAGYTETLDATPAEVDSNYVAWSNIPVSPPFASEQDAVDRLDEVIGKVLDDQGLTDPPPPEPIYINRMSVLQFRGRFTVSEKSAIYSSTDVGVRIILDDLNAASFISVADPATIQAVDYFISASLIDPGRRSDLLAQVEATEDTPLEYYAL